MIICRDCGNSLEEGLRFCVECGASASISSGPLNPKQFIGQIVNDEYRIVEVIGEGESGCVYKAIHLATRRPVAVKIFHFDLSSNELSLGRFKRQAGAIAGIQHPNVVALIDFGVLERTGNAYVVKEFLEGVSLREKLKGVRQLDYEEMVQIVKQVFSALNAAHSKGIVQGDLKPENIWLLEWRGGVGEIKIDFDLRLRDVVEIDNRAQGKVTGGPHYMSPEQCLGEALDARSDIYSLGVIIYEMLTGRVPVEGCTPTETVVKKITEVPTPLHQLRRDIPSRVEDVVLRALSSRPEDRQPTVSQFAHEFEEAIRESRIGIYVRPAIAAVASCDERANTGEKQRPPIYLDENVQFTVYRPNKIRPQKWYTLLAFAHLSERSPYAADDEPDPIEEVQRQARLVLGEQASEYQDLKQESRSPVPREGELTFVPEIPGIEFNPSCRNFVWQESVHREDFRLRASSKVDGETLRGRLTVFLGSIILAEVDLSIKVDSSDNLKTATVPQVIDRGRAFRKIFASYSHKDVTIVEQFERFVSATGDEYVRDWTHLRAGEVWDKRLMEMIGEATIFQLFWSTNSMHSEFVRHEWEHALSLERQNFIRPLYWEDPFPESADKRLPPQALRRLQFHRLITSGLTDPPAQRPETSAGLQSRPVSDRVPSVSNLVSLDADSFIAASPPLGKGVVERTGRKKSLRKLYSLLSGSALVAMIAFVAGVLVYQNLRSKPEFAGGLSKRAEDEAARKAAAPMTPGEIVDEYSNAVVAIDVSWKLINTQSGRQVYHIYVPNVWGAKDGNKYRIVNDGRREVATYWVLDDGVYEPALTDHGGSHPIGGGGSGSGFTVTSDGFILTARHVGAGWNTRYQYPDDAYPGVLWIVGPDGKWTLRTNPETGMPLTYNIPTSWVPSNTRQFGRDGLRYAVEGRPEYENVTFPGNKTPFPAKVARVSDRHDVCLLKIDVPSGVPKVELHDTYDTIKAGDNITVLGYPAVSPIVYGIVKSQDVFNREAQFKIVPDPSVATGNVGRVIRSKEGSKDTETSSFGDAYQLTANPGSGNSGGPVFDDRGGVIGIYYAGRTLGGGASGQVSFAVPIRYAEELLASVSRSNK